MNELTAETTVTAEHTPTQIVAAMLANGASEEEFATSLIDWVSEGDPVDMTIAELVAEWMTEEDDPNAELWLNSYNY